MDSCRKYTTHTVEVFNSSRMQIDIQLPSYFIVHIGRKEQNTGEGEISDALHQDCSMYRRLSYSSMTKE